MKQLLWSQLNRLQLGRYAEYLTEMEFTAYGFDVFRAEVGDKGIDFVVRKSDTQYMVCSHHPAPNNKIQRDLLPYRFVNLVAPAK